MMSSNIVMIVWNHMYSHMYIIQYEFTTEVPDSYKKCIRSFIIIRLHSLFWSYFYLLAISRFGPLNFSDIMWFLNNFWCNYHVFPPSDSRMVSKSNIDLFSSILMRILCAQILGACVDHAKSNRHMHLYIFNFP